MSISEEQFAKLLEQLDEIQPDDQVARLIAQGASLGFSDEISRKLVQQTAIGAASMVVSNSDLEIGELRANVTSKGGTTHAALTTLIDGGLTPLVAKAVNSALARAQELAKQ